MDPTTFALQAELSDEKDAETVLRELNQHLHTALTSKLTPQDKQQTINTFANLFGKLEWILDLNSFAFIVGRQYQLQIDNKALIDAVQGVTDADIQLLATSIFAPEKQATVIIELEQ
jgi:predicted Zn-dependent peptidase